jgi:hypothetical protein
MALVHGAKDRSVGGDGRRGSRRHVGPAGSIHSVYRWCAVMLRTINKFAEIVAGLVLMALVYEGAQWLLTATGAPVEITSVEALNSPLSTGEDLIVRVHRTKIRDCPVTSQPWIQDQDGRIIQTRTLSWRGGLVGASYLDVAYSTNELPIGDYVLHVTLTYNCPDRYYKIPKDSVKFRVLP